jgi:hypothetical protein
VKAYKNYKKMRGFESRPDRQKAEALQEIGVLFCPKRLLFFDASYG